MAKLKTYRAKRDFGKTSEPRGKASRTRGNGYVIQKHAATRLHYDLRLEFGGVMLSWAVTRGPSLVPDDKRLAVHVEDHPIEYNTFEGTIPKGQYGGGTVMVWDRGRWEPEYDPEFGLKKGHLEFTLHGKKLKGRWHLVRMNKRPGERQEPWLLIKSDDEYARTKSQPDILEEMPDSAASGRSMDEIAHGRSRVWHSNKPVSEQSKRRVAPGKSPAKSRPRTPRNHTSAGTVQKKKAKEKSKGSTRKAGSLSHARRSDLPTFVSPCLATLAARPPNSAGWVHEIKFDGYRMQARIGGGTVQLRTRTGLDWTTRFPTIAEGLGALKKHDAVIDGEVVSGDERGVADFSALQDDLKSGRRDRLVYYAFDLLHLDGYDITRTPLAERKSALAGLLDELSADGVVRLSEHFETDGAKMLQLAAEMRLEGIVSKRIESAYRAGRAADWLKIKCSNSQELVVAGYAPSDISPRRMAALVLGYYDTLGFRYAGRVGTGFTDRMRDEWWKRLQPLRVDRCPFGTVPEEERTRTVEWVKPQVVVEVDFRGWTGSGYVRQASFKGIREDKPAKQVTREVEEDTPAVKQAAARPTAQKNTSAKSKRAVTVAGVTLTNPDRIYWEDAGVTKAMLAGYYEKIWKWMQPHVAGRVLSLVRAPDGVGGQTFYQKHASAGMDRDRLHLVKEPDGDESISIDDAAGLVSLAQAGVLEVHVRGSTIKHLEEADRLVFDLDPGPGVEWKEVIAAAREVRQRLADLKLRSFVKTTGGKGLHVVLPVRPVPWDDAKEFCRLFAEQMAADAPGRYTATIKKTARKNRIFVDYLRNSREATAIAPYSTRARPGATVSVPLSWEELGKQKTPNAFSVLNLPQRLARMRTDPWAAMGRIKQSLPAARKRK